MPVGKNDEEKMARIVRVEHFEGNCAPVPVSALKYIIDIAVYAISSVSATERILPPMLTTLPIS